MAYCKKCGRKVDDESMFCPGCGTPIDREELTVSVDTGNDADESETRRQVYVGLIRKCPSCGTELTSDAAICPKCGFELNTRKGAQAVEAFANQLNSIDEQIAASGQSTEKGWNAWTTPKKIGWVVLNIFTVGLPIIIPFIIKQFRIITVNPKPYLTALEERKAELIENYVVPNEKGAMLELLRFIRTKVEALNRQSKNERLLYWMNLWAVKAGQINSKAKNSLNDDPDIGHQYDAINEMVQSVNKSMSLVACIKAAIAAAVAIMIIFCAVTFWGTFFRELNNPTIEEDQSVSEIASNESSLADKDSRVVNEYSDVEIGGLIIRVPDYYGDNTSEDDTFNYFAEKGDGVVTLDIRCYNEGQDNESFLMGYDAFFDSFFDGVANAVNVTRSNEQVKFKTDSGLTGVYEVFVVKFSGNEKEIMGDGCVALINNPDHKSMVSISTIQSRQSQYNYFPGYEEMLKTTRSSTTE